jgi:hypothetical protein
VAERLEAFVSASATATDTAKAETPTLQQRLAAMGAVPALGTRPLPAVTPDHTSRLSPTKSRAVAEMKRALSGAAATPGAISPPKFDLVAASGTTVAVALVASSAPPPSASRSPPKGLPRVGGRSNSSSNNSSKNKSNKIRTSNGGGADNELAAALARRRGAIGE